MKTILFYLGLAFTLSASTWMIWQKEDTLAHGRTVLLELRPRDPRSLMQGDYMVLAYAIATEVSRDQLRPSGRLIVRLDENGVGKYARLDDGGALSADEQRIEYHDRGGLEIGAESFFFEEGTGGTFAQAKYAELKVSQSGECLLTALCDEKRERLKPEKAAR